MSGPYEPTRGSLELKQRAEQRAAVVQKLRKELAAGGMPGEVIRRVTSLAQYGSTDRIRHSYLIHQPDGVIGHATWADHPHDLIELRRLGRPERLSDALRRLAAQE